MKNLNEEKATVSSNKQKQTENMEMEELVFEIVPESLVWDYCKNLEAIFLDTDKIVNSFVKQIQKIKPSLTDEKAKQLIDNLYHDVYRDMLYEDYITCLAYENTKPDDYKQISYKILEKMARISLYYIIAAKEIMFKRYNVSRMNDIMHLSYEAYKAVATAKAKAIESLKNINDTKYTIFTEIFSSFEKKYGLSYFTDRKIYDFIKQSIDRLFENVEIEYSAKIVDYEYEKSDENVYECSIKTNLHVIYHFDVSMLREIDETLKQYNPNINLRNAIFYFEHKGEDEDEDEDTILNTVLKGSCRDGRILERGNEYSDKFAYIKKTYTIYHYFDDLDFKPLLLHLENLKNEQDS